MVIDQKDHTSILNSKQEINFFFYIFTFMPGTTYKIFIDYMKIFENSLHKKTYPYPK